MGCGQGSGTVMPKSNRDAACVQLFQLPPSIFTSCSAPLPVSPQQLTTSLEEIFHGQIPSYCDEHSTLKVGKGIKGVHHISSDHRERKRGARRELNSNCAPEQ